MTTLWKYWYTQNKILNTWKLKMNTIEHYTNLAWQKDRLYYHFIYNAALKCSELHKGES